MKNSWWLYVKQIWKARKDEGVKASFGVVIFATAVLIVMGIVGCKLEIFTDLFGGNFYGITIETPVCTWIISSDVNAIVCRTLSLAYWLCALALIGVDYSTCKLFVKAGLVASALDASNLMHTNHGETIAEVIYNIRRRLVEINAFFGKDGRKMGEATILSPKETYTSPEAVDYLDSAGGYKCTDIHNHPGGYLAFSPVDLDAIFTYHISRAIVIAGKMVYTIEIPDDCWDELDALDGNPAQGYADLEKQLSNLHIFQMVGCGNWSTKHTAVVSSAACKAIAERYGFKFTAEKYKKSQYYKDYEALVWRRFIASIEREGDAPAMACHAEPELPTSLFEKMCCKILIHFMK